MSLTEIYQHQ